MLDFLINASLIGLGIVAIGMLIDKFTKSRRVDLKEGDVLTMIREDEHAKMSVVVEFKEEHKQFRVPGSAHKVLLNGEELKDEQ